MFSDIVASTERAAALGDARWRELMGRHDDLTRAELERHRGREVKTMGDGLLATFDGPARAIRCARTIADNVGALDIELRAGLHTGECELVGDDIGGLAVNIGARIGALAGADEVLVSSTVHPTRARYPRAAVYLRGHVGKRARQVYSARPTLFDSAAARAYAGCPAGLMSRGAGEERLR
jgi:class 3 adenylate cyclase